MKKVFLQAIATGLIFVSCDRVTEKANQAIDSGARKVENAIDSGAQAVGKTAADVVNNIDKGITKSSKVDISLTEQLKNEGLSFGKYYFRNDQSKGNDNILSIYLITDKDFNKPLRAKLFDKNGLEMGRANLTVKQKAGDAGYHDFVFDPKIDFEYQSKLVIE